MVLFYRAYQNLNVAKSLYIAFNLAKDTTYIHMLEGLRNMLDMTTDNHLLG